MFNAKTPNGRMGKTMLIVCVVILGLFIIVNVLSMLSSWLMDFYNKLSKETVTAIIVVSVFWNLVWIINNLLHARSNK